MRPYEELFAGWEYVGIDVEASGRPAENKRVDLFFDGLDIPFEDASFDAVLCTEVLEHCVDADRLVGEMYRVLRSGGHAVITVPFMWGEHELPFDFRRYSTNGVRRLLETSGFEVMRIERSQPGIAAIEALVSSEITNSLRRCAPSRSIVDRVLRRVEPFAWVLVRRIWAAEYAFDRIYVDNLVLARRRGPG
jgi:SAM-dependent methyltransferase